MKRKNIARAWLIILILVLLLASMLACKIDGGDGWGTPTVDTSAGGAIAATATYGAEQFHLQLTAIATEE